MKKYIKNLLIIFCVVFSTGLKAQNSYFTIGSSENTVIQVQGQPSSIMRTGNYSTFMFGTSSVSFTNKIVDGYNNTGNLKIKVGSSSNNNSSTRKKTIHKNTKIAKKVNNEVKWIYFTFIPKTNDLFRENEYSKIYSISNYSYEMQNNLEFCLQKEYKEMSGNGVLLLPHIYDSRDILMYKWNDEKGRLTSIPMCNYLMQYGVTEH
jgi:hypothetical protein